MFFYSVYVILVIMSKRFLQVESVRLLELRIPGHASEGDQALLGCQYDLEGDLLYSVKWYKDGREFYRYVPLNEPPSIYFPTAGVVIDMSRSSSNVVVLSDLNQDSAGLYRCEVSGEAPLFATVYQEKYINIHLLPKYPPVISGAPTEGRLGDRIVANCTTSPSRPYTQVKWVINHRVAPRHLLQGPWYRLSVDRYDAAITIMQLRFSVTKRHLQKGLIVLKCQATLAPLYQKETEHVIQLPSPEELDFEVTPALSIDRVGQLMPTSRSFTEIEHNEDLPSSFDILYPDSSATNKGQLINIVIALAILLHIL